MLAIPNINEIIIRTGEKFDQITKFEIEGNTNYVKFNLDSSLLAVRVEIIINDEVENKVLIYETVNFELVATIPTEFSVKEHCLIFNPTEMLLGFENGNVMFVNITSFEVITTVNFCEELSCMSYNSDFSILGCGYLDGKVRLFSNCLLIKMIELYDSDCELIGEIVGSICFSPIENVVIFTTEGSTYVYNYENNSVVKEIDMFCTSIATHDGKIIAAGCYHDDPIYFYNFEDNSEYESDERHLEMVCLVMFSKDGSVVISSSVDDSICMWDAKTGIKILEIIHKTSSDYYLDFSG